MGGHGVAMIEVPHLAGMERNTLVWLAVHLYGDAVLGDLLDRSHIAIRNAQIAGWCGELDPVTFCKVPADLLIGRDTLEAFRVVGYLVALIEAHGEAIGFGVDCGDGGIGAFSIPCSLLPFE